MNYWNLPRSKTQGYCYPIGNGRAVESTHPIEKEYLDEEHKRRAEELEKARKEYKKKKGAKS